MQHFLIVALGGGIGAGLRHLVNLGALRALGPSFPWGTLAVNIIGSLAMGLLVGVLAARVQASAELRLFAATGVLGGFTTFSAFSLDAVTLFERGQAGSALVYVAASVILSIAALMLGLALIRGG